MQLVYRGQYQLWAVILQYRQMQTSKLVDKEICVFQWKTVVEREQFLKPGYLFDAITQEMRPKLASHQQLYVITRSKLYRTTTLPVFRTTPDRI